MFAIANPFLPMKAFLTSLFLCINCTLAIAQNGLDKNVLDMLDRHLNMKQEYDNRKQARIDSLRLQLQVPGNDSLCSALCSIGKEYETFISDSALVFYDRALHAAKSMHDNTLMTKAELGRIKVLGIMGFFHEAMIELDSIEQNGIPPSLEGEWLDCGRQLYSYIEAYTVQSKNENMNPYLDKYVERQNYYRQKLLKLLTPGTIQHSLFLAEQYYTDGQTQRAKKILMGIIDSSQPDNNIYARAAANLALIRINEDNPDDAARYFALSAIADIRTSTKENTSLQQLAVYLYDIGDINHAYHYITASLADAVFCNARLRTTEISNITPLIDEAYKVQLRQKHKSLMVAALISTLLAIGFVGACIFLLKQMRKLNATRRQLNDANSIKDEYIGHFLDLCSIYMDRLDNFCKTVTRKITAGQIEDLVRMAKSPKFAEEQHKQFYENFDEAFLHIYPTFIEDFNKLLQPEERIAVKAPGRLTTELRIFAFLRMGVDDANKIAGFLHYSVNTIYAYRNKVRNKAIDREHFEENIMKIGSIS